jgi:hypothetical protein
MAQFRRLWATFEVDKVKCSFMKEDAKRKLAEKAPKSKSGGWTNNDHGGDYRRPGHADIDPDQAKEKTRLKRLDRSLQKCIVRRDARKSPNLGVTVTIHKPAPVPRACRGAGSSPKRQILTTGGFAGACE